MLSPSEQQLVSALIDNELSGDERAYAERLLESSADARQLHDELSSVSSELKSLPQATLPADFSKAVLRAAEREMLSADPWPDADTTPASQEPHRWLNTRTWAYTATVIAAALALMLFLPERQPLPVAQNEATDAEAEKKEGAAKEDIDDESPKVDSKATGGKSKRENQGAKSADLKEVAKNVEKLSAHKFDEKAADKDDDFADEAPAGQALNGRHPADNPFAGGDAGGGGAKTEEDANVDPFGAGNEESKLAVRSRGLKDRTSRASKFLVVHVDAKDVARGGKALRRVLAKHAVAVPVKSGYLAAQSVDATKLAEADKFKKEAGRFSNASRDGEVAVYAETSPERLGAILDELSALPKDFAAVAIESNGRRFAAPAARTIATNNLDKPATPSEEPQSASAPATETPPKPKQEADSKGDGQVGDDGESGDPVQPGAAAWRAKRDKKTHKTADSIRVLFVLRPSPAEAGAAAEAPADAKKE